MKTKASTLTLRIPQELKHRIEKIADEQGVSINQLALYVFAKEVQDIETSLYFSRYCKTKNKNQIISDFDEVMKKVDNKEVPPWDKMQF